MGSQQFCLRWNNHQRNLLSVFDKLLINESFVDVTLACEGSKIKAHKVVLSACSPFFEELFDSNPCKHPIVILRDMQYVDLKAIVQFMYKGEVNVTQEQLSQLLKTAESLKIKGLAEMGQEEQPVHDTRPKPPSKPTPQEQFPSSKQRFEQSPSIISASDYQENLSAASPSQPSSSRRSYREVRPPITQNMEPSINIAEPVEPTLHTNIPSTSKQIDSIMPSRDIKNETHEMPIIHDITENIITKEEPPEILDIEENETSHSTQSEYMLEPHELCDQNLSKESEFDFESMEQFGKENDMSEGASQSPQEVGGTDDLPMGMSYTEALPSPSTVSQLEGGSSSNLIELPDAPYLYTCTICTKKFKCKNGYLGHMSHFHGPDAGKHYKCSFCEKSFRWKSDAECHIRDFHSSEGNFLTCFTCGKSFESKGSFRRHMRHFHSSDDAEPQTCPECGKSYQWKRDLQRHMKHVHYPDRMEAHICAECGKSYQWKKGLQRHMKDMHSK